jgi:hypothetical protein
MRFPEFLRATVSVSAAAATLLALLTLAGVNGNGATTIGLLGICWWVIAAIIGLSLGRRHGTSPPIAGLLAAARSQMTLPELNPGRTVLNRLWPIIVCTIAAGVFAFALPQIPAIAAGFPIIWALSWRRQAAAVVAIEQRDGSRFYVERTSPLRAIKLVRTPGLRSNLTELQVSRRADRVLGRRA